MPADWKIEFWPVCTRHVFLSHCREDRERLVLPVTAALHRQGCQTWLDRHDYPTGRDPFEALRDNVLQCRHVVYFVTSEYLKQGRGWTGIERAIAATVQHNLRYGTSEVCHVELPLYFLPRDHHALGASAWGATVGSGRGCFYARGRVDSGAIEWAAQEILNFVRQEEQYAIELDDRLSKDSRMNRQFSADKNLRDRILAHTPPPMRPPGV